LSIKEQPTPPISSTQIEKPLSTSNKSDRRKYIIIESNDIDFYFLANLNRQQQHIQSEEDKQHEIATSMIASTKSLLNSATRLNDIVKDDKKVCLIYFNMKYLFLIL